ncbi:ribbon-helix-helix domain-containing protein [Scytonema sp. NUACC26]|uniref:ribbon-helix-helix domain-containing protein n=1 Tax=Scytonema sp. NUACC26 TaxID=3140176 RepID=UPI0038B3E0D3
MSKKFSVTVPDSVFNDLERLAELQGRPTANLAAFLIELGVREAKERGELPYQTDTIKKDRGAA